MRKITILIALFIGVMLGCQNSDLELVPTENLQSNDPEKHLISLTMEKLTLHLSIWKMTHL